MRRILRLLPFVVLLVIAGAVPALAEPDDLDVIVLFKPGTDVATRDAVIRQTGSQVRHHLGSVAVTSARLADRALRTLLENHPDVQAVIPDRAMHAHAQVTPAGVQRIAAAPGSLGVTGANVGVAIVDTGTDFNHVDLKPIGVRCFTSFTSCQDDNGHGTHVSGIVAARNNGSDVVGVAPDATIYAVKVLNSQGSGSDSSVMAGLDWVVQNAASVSPRIRAVNMSLGRRGTIDDNIALRQVVVNLYNAGITVVVSAGNDATLEASQQVPATYPEVLAIASTTALTGTNGGCRSFRTTIPSDTASYFTTDGDFIDATRIGVSISAPGEEREDVTRHCFISSVGILSTRLGGGTTRMSGTSMAAPHVTGVVALMWEKALGLGQTVSPETARSAIRTSASRPGTAPLNAPTSTYTFDGEREGVVSAPGALGAIHP